LPGELLPADAVPYRILLDNTKLAYGLAPPSREKKLKKLVKTTALVLITIRNNAVNIKTICFRIFFIEASGLNFVVL
jgi:hypothetical protein